MITILMPTKDSPFDVYKKLLFYEKFKLNGEILIGDSSSEYNFKILNKLLDNYKFNIDFSHLSFPSLSEAKTTKKLIELSKYDYLVWSGDDDFLIPNTLLKCVNFLKVNKNFKSVHGKGIALLVEKDKIKYSWKYEQPYFEADDPQVRLEQYFKNSGDTHYSVHRKDVIKRMYSHVDKFKTHLISAANLPIYISVISGNMKEISELSIVRTVTSHRRFNYTDDFINGLHNKDWLEDYNLLRECLTLELSKEMNIKKNKAESIIINYLKKNISINLKKINNQKQNKLNNSSFFIKIILKLFNKLFPKNVLKKKAFYVKKGLSKEIDEIINLIQINYESN